MTGKRYSTALAGAGELPASGSSRSSAGEADKLDRETVVRLGAAAERRLGGRTVRSLALWLEPLADVLEGGAAAAAELIARGVVEGSYEPQAIYREKVESAPPALDELILIASGAVTALDHGGRRGRSWARARIARTLANRAANDVSPEVLADEARAIAEQHGLWIDVIDPSERRRWAWACSWPSGAGRTTRLE